MEKLVDWLGSCSFDDSFFQPGDEACRKWIAPYFRQAAPPSLEEMITTTLKLYKEVQYIRDQVLADQLKLNYVTRKEFALRVMTAWRDQHPSYRSVIEAICYELPWTAS